MPLDKHWAKNRGVTFKALGKVMDGLLLSQELTLWIDSLRQLEREGPDRGGGVLLTANQIWYKQLYLEKYYEDDVNKYFECK